MKAAGWRWVRESLQVGSRDVRLWLLKTGKLLQQLNVLFQQIHFRISGDRRSLRLQGRHETGSFFGKFTRGSSSIRLRRVLSCLLQHGGRQPIQVQAFFSQLRKETTTETTSDIDLKPAKSWAFLPQGVSTSSSESLRTAQLATEWHEPDIPQSASCSSNR